MTLASISGIRQPHPTHCCCTTVCRWVHHTSLLWDFQPQRMQLLKQPAKQPEYRQVMRGRTAPALAGGVCKCMQSMASLNFTPLLPCITHLPGHSGCAGPRAPRFCGTSAGVDALPAGPHRCAVRQLGGCGVQGGRGRAGGGRGSGGGQHSVWHTPPGWARADSGGSDSLLAGCI